MTDEERRREFPRVEAAFRVRYPTIDKLVVAYTQDLSRGGMFLKTSRYLPINTVLRLHIELPHGGGEVSVIARVVYVRDEKSAASSGKPPGMGIQFLDLAGDTSNRIEQFIADCTTVEHEKSEPIRITRAINILIVDDDEGFREGAAAPFRKRKDRVRVAKDGLEALAACLKERPDLLVTDVQMPRMDGLQLLRLIRARPSLGNLPVMFLTSVASDEDRLKGYQFGADDYLAKPFDVEELVARVNRIVARHANPNAPPVERRTLRGDLEQMALGSVLSFLEIERKSGVLLVIGRCPAQIFLREGRPLTATIADAPGKPPRDALDELLDWPSGQFEFATQDVAAPDELGTSITSLLLSHATKQDESKRDAE